MAQDATGTATALGIPKYNPAADSPSGRGFNAAMDAIDAIITAKQLPTAATNTVPVWNGSAWVAQTITDNQVASNAAIAWSKITSRPFCIIKLGADQSIPNGGADLTLNTTVKDTDLMADNASNRMVVKTAGFYKIISSIAWADLAGTFRGTLTKVNGGVVGVGSYFAGVNSGFSGTVGLEIVYVQLAVNDVLTLRANQNSGGAVTVWGTTTNPQHTYLSAERLAA